MEFMENGKVVSRTKSNSWKMYRGHTTIAERNWDKKFEKI